MKTGAECCWRASFSLKSGIQCPYDSQINKSCSINFQHNGGESHWIFGEAWGMSEIIIFVVKDLLLGLGLNYVCDGG